MCYIEPSVRNISRDLVDSSMSTDQQTLFKFYNNSGEGSVEVLSGKEGSSSDALDSIIPAMPVSSGPITVISSSSNTSSNSDITVVSQPAISVVNSSVNVISTVAASNSAISAQLSDNLKQNSSDPRSSLPIFTTAGGLSTSVSTSSVTQSVYTSPPTSLLQPIAPGKRNMLDSSME